MNFSQTTVRSSINCGSIFYFVHVLIDSYQSECGSISQHSNHSESTAATGRTVAEESFDVYCDPVTKKSLSHLSLSVITFNVPSLMCSILL